MPLSDREKKVLEELERGLFADDKDFAERVSKAASKAEAKSSSGKSRSDKTAKNSGKQLVAGALLSVAGISILIFGVVAQWIPIGVVGFLVTLAGLVVASSNWSNSNLKQKPQKNSQNNWFEDRWNSRFDN